MSERLDRVEALLERSVIASDERMARIENRLERSISTSDERMSRVERSISTSDERMSRVERGLDETRQLVQSNSRSLEALAGEIRSLGQKIDLYISLRNQDLAAGNDERQALVTRMSRMQRTLDKISNHLGVDEGAN